MGSYFGNTCARLIAATALVTGVLLALAAIGKERLHLPALILAGIAVGITWFSAFQHTHLDPIQHLDGRTEKIQIHISGFPQETAYGCAVAGAVSYDSRDYGAQIYLNRNDTTLQLQPGDEISGRFFLRLTLDGGEAVSDYYQGKGIWMTASQRSEITVEKCDKLSLSDRISQWNDAILKRIWQIFPEDAAGFAQALLLGDGSELTYETDTALKVSGIRHVIAVSGLHVSILFSMLQLFSARKRWLMALIGTPTLLLFAAIAGFTPSITRACVMQCLMILSLLLDREYDQKTALAFAALVMLLFRPTTILSVSFQLSVGCMAGIHLFSDRIRTWILSVMNPKSKKLRGVKGQLVRWFASSVSVTLGAMTMTTPLSAWHFGMVSLIGVVTNLLTVWLVSWLFCGILAVLAVGLFWEQAASAIAWLLSWGIRFITGLAQTLSRIPFAAVYTKSIYVVLWLLFAYGLLVAFVLCRRKRPVVFTTCLTIGLCLALLLSWMEPLLDDCRLTVLDVGQGQCILLQSGGRSYLVDCGGKGAATTADEAAETLLSQGITRLDGMILTHFDQDHTAGAANLLTRVDADVIFLPMIPDENDVTGAISKETDGSVCILSQAVCLAWEKAELTIYPSTQAGADNEGSLCVLFQTENCAILITGDRDALGERLLLRDWVIPEIDVLVVGHHGSRFSTSEELLRAVRPKTAIISVGKDNAYGHPATQTLERLKKYGCEVYRTDLYGTIIYRR